MTLPNNSIQGFSTAALAAAYAKQARSMLEQIHALFNNQNGRMQQSLRALDDEVAKIEEDEERLEAENAQLEQTLGVYNDTLNTAADMISVNSPDIQLTGQMLAIPVMTARIFSGLANTRIQAGQNPITQGALGFYTEQLATNGVAWNTDALAAATSYVDSQAWIDRMNTWGDGYADLTRNTILNGIQQGWGPKRVASQMRQTAQGLPVPAAENITRTLQLTAFRDAQLAMELSNPQAIIKKIRIAQLSPTTCLNCIALHGTEIPLGERVHDHNRGFCDAFFVVPGGPEHPDFMQADSKPGQRNFVPYQNGVDWFNGLSPERQAQQASFMRTPAKLRAFEAGTPLSAFVKEHEDKVFGLQVVEDSLKNAIGIEQAEQFYSVNQ